MTGTGTGAALVSVGMPVHNGATTLPRALKSVLGQSYPHLEVVVSDNASTDGTEAICRRAAADDPRVRYFRQPRAIPAWENFRFVLEQATGEYFFWAADDDLHSPNFVDTLVGTLSSHPAAVLAVGDIVQFPADADPTSGALVKSGTGPWPDGDAALLRHVILSPCSEFYGLFRTQCLREFPWSGFDYGPDHILLFYVGLRGDVVHGPGAVFYESIRRSPKRRRLRVRQGFYRSMGRFRMVRFSAQMVTMARAAHGGPIPATRSLRIFAYSYYLLRATLGKTFIYEHAPRALVRVWRMVKPHQPEPRLTA